MARSSAVTTASYGLLLAFGLAVGLPGPAVPSLQAAYGLSYAGAALHLTMFSAGSGIASVVDTRLGRRFARGTLLRAALLGVAAGAMASGLAATAAISLAGIAVMGFCGTIAMNIAHGALGAEHGDGRDTALARAHLFAALGLVAAALSVTAARGVGMWRLAFAMPVGLVILLLVWRVPTRLTRSRREAEAAVVRSAPPHPAVRIGGVVLALSVVVEWAVTFWAASFLRDPIGMTPTYADVATIVVIAALVVGRWLLTRLTTRVVAAGLLRVAFVVVIAASLPYLFGSRLSEPYDVAVPIVALSVLCLTVTMLFPLALAVTMGAAGGSDVQQQRASATALATGAVGAVISPFVLGAIADATTLTTALLVLPTASLVALAGIAAMDRSTAHPRPAPT